MITASRNSVRRRGLAISAIGWGIAITAAALAPNMPLEYAAMVFVGYGSISFTHWQRPYCSLRWTVRLQSQQPARPPRASPLADGERHR